MKSMINMYSRFKNQKGSALVLVIIVFLVLMIFGMGITLAMTTESRQSTHKSAKNQAYYFARSGVELAYDYLLNLDPDKIAKWLDDEDDLEVYIYGDFNNLDIKASEGDNNLGLGLKIPNSEEEIFATIKIVDSEFNIHGLGKFNDVTSEVGLTLSDGKDVPLGGGSSGGGESVTPPQIPSTTEDIDKLLVDIEFDYAGDKDLHKWINGNNLPSSEKTTEKSVKFKNNNPIKVTPNSNPNFTAQSFHFASELNVMFDTGNNKKNTVLELTATGSGELPGLIIFDKQVTLQYHTQHGSSKLCLQADKRDLFYQFRGGLFTKSQQGNSNPEIVESVNKDKVYHLKPGEKICFPGGDPKKYTKDNTNGESEEPGWKNIADWDGRWN